MHVGVNNSAWQYRTSIETVEPNEMKTAMDSNQNCFCLKFEIKMRVVCVWFRVELSGSLKSKCMLFVWFRIELSGSLKPK